MLLNLWKQTGFLVVKELYNVAKELLLFIEEYNDHIQLCIINWVYSELYKLRIRLVKNRHFIQ